jgi:hypothetical protein
MKKKHLGVLAMGSLLAGSLAINASLSFAQSEKAAAPEMPKVGDTAPDFTLHYFDGNDLKEMKLSDYRGKKNVVLAFYIFAFTGG